MSTQSQTITNPGPLPMKVTGGTLGTPATLSTGQSGTFVFSDAAPLQIELIPAGGGGLAGGGGEE